MRVFVSYSRHDETAAEALVRDLESARIEAWFDRELRGGDEWWAQILEHIRTAAVLLLATSDHALRSKPCLAEVDYARRLGLPILPVRVGPVGNVRTEVIADLQVLDRAGSGVPGAPDVAAAIRTAAGRGGPLPDPLPAAPPAPYAYLTRLGHRIGAAEIDPTAQIGLVAELRYALHQEYEPSVQHDVTVLLHRLRDRPDVTRAAWAEIDRVLRDWSVRPSMPPVAGEIPDGPGVWPPGWYADPEGTGRRRWFDGVQWTMTYEAATSHDDGESSAARRRKRSDDAAATVGFVLASLAVLPAVGIAFGVVAAGIALSVMRRRHVWARPLLVCSCAGLLIGLIVTVTLGSR